MPKTMSTDGSDNSKTELPWENLDATPDGLIVTSDEGANNVQLDDSSTISKAIDEAGKVCIKRLMCYWCARIIANESL